MKTGHLWQYLMLGCAYVNKTRCAIALGMHLDGSIVKLPLKQLMVMPYHDLGDARFGRN